MCYFNKKVLINQFFSRADIRIPIFPSPKKYGRCWIEAFLTFFQPQNDFSIDLLYDFDRNSIVANAVRDMFSHPYANHAYICFIISNKQLSAVHFVHVNDIFRIFCTVTEIINHPDNLSELINLKQRDLEKCLMLQETFYIRSETDYGFVPDPSKLNELRILQEEERKIKQENIRAVAVTTNPHTIYSGYFIGQGFNLSLSSYPFSECHISYTPRAKRPWKFSICNSSVPIIGGLPYDSPLRLGEPRERLGNSADSLTAELLDSAIMELFAVCNQIVSQWENGSLESFNGVEFPSYEPLFVEEFPDGLIEEMIDKFAENL